MTLLTGPISAVCDICGIQTGNLPKHRKACARKAGTVATAGPITAMEQDLIERAGSFAAADAVLNADAQMRGGVTDLDMARLLLALDSGAEIVMGKRTDTWVAPAGSPLKGFDGQFGRRSLSKVVNEAIRLGLAHVAVDRETPALVRTYLAPALTHARSRFNRVMPACQHPTTTIKRYRLMDRDRLALVDCQACVDIVSHG